MTDAGIDRERQIKILKLRATANSAISVIALSLAAMLSFEPKATVEIREPQNDPAILSVTGLRVVDRLGNVRVELRPGSERGAYFNLRDAEGSTIASIGVLRSGGAALTLGPPAAPGSLMVSAAAGPEDCSSIVFLDRTGHVGLLAGTTPEGAALSVHGGPGQGVFRIHPEDGRLRAVMLDQDSSLIWSAHGEEPD